MMRRPHRIDGTMNTDDDIARLLEAMQRFDAYTLGDAARRAGTGGVLRQLLPQTGRTQFVGRALTARIHHEQHRSIPLKDYGGAQLREQAQPGDVVLIDGGGLMLSAMGDLAFANLVRRGAAAAVVNACVRDVEQLEALQLPLPVFALGVAIASVAGAARIVDVGAPIYLSGMRIETGDLVAGCRGGIVAIPWADRDAVLAQAELILDSDRRVREGIERGESMTQLWAQHKAF